MTEFDCVSVAGLSTRRPVEPPMDSRRGTDQWFLESVIVWTISQLTY
jgi:hypothetical protein